MNFTSIAFYVLFAICILALVCLDKFGKSSAVRNKCMVLIFLSAIFCGWQDWRFEAIVITEAVFVYFVTLLIEKTEKKVWIATGVTGVLLCLGIFKYYGFFTDTFKFFGLTVKRIELILPIGISFYSFSAIGYMLDVYRKKYQAEKNFWYVLLYMIFFPKLTAGPIIAADSFFEQIKQNRRITLANLSEGFQIIIFGLVKKNVLSDNIAVFVDAVYSNVEMYNAPTLVLAVLAYGMQIYLDFSGYSDLAIGCSKCLGFDMPRNFNLPYLSRNVTEFWKRWHITLSEWLMRYLYISLGGNRKDYVRTLINLVLTMAIGGLWHGAGWNFVLWGLLHGLALCVHKHYMKIKGIGKDFVPTKIGYLVGVVCTFLYANFCWIFFRISDLQVIKRLLIRIVTWSEGVAFYSTWAIIALLAVLVATIVAIVKNWSQQGKLYTVNGYYMIRDLSKFHNMVLLFTILGIILAMAYAYSNPFIYANF